MSIPLNSRECWTVALRGSAGLPLLLRANFLPGRWGLYLPYSLFTCSANSALSAFQLWNLGLILCELRVYFSPLSVQLHFLR